MPSIAFAVLLPPGRAEANLEALRCCWTGARKEAFRDARRRAGIVREAVWIQPTSGGELAIVYLEADDVDLAISVLATSTEPFDRWFRDHVREIHGVALTGELIPAGLALDYDTDRP